MTTAHPMQDWDTGFDRLPPELVQQVFFYTQSPVLLSHVCRKWRFFVHDSPELWDSATLSANLFRSPSDNIAKFQDILALYTAHSSLKRPFYLKIDWKGHASTMLWVDQSFSLPTNIRDLEFIGNEVQLNGIYRPRELARLYNLEALRLVDPDTNAPDDVRISGNPILTMLPNLRMLCLSIRASSLFTPSTEGFTSNISWWAQLTHLCIEKEMGLRAWHLLIRKCPRLEKCLVDFSLSIRRPDYQDDLNFFTIGSAHTQPSVILDNLKELEVGFSSNFFPSVFCGIRAPALRELYLENHPKRPPELGFQTMPSTFNFLCGVAPHLRCLSLLNQHHINADNVLVILRLTRHLHVLQLGVEGNHDNLLGALCVDRLGVTNNEINDIQYQDRSQTLVPNLVSFDLYISPFFRRNDADPPTFSAEAYSHAVVTRWLQWREIKMAAGHLLERANDTIRWVLKADSSHSIALEGVRTLTNEARQWGLRLDIDLQNGPLSLWEHGEGCFTWADWKEEQGFPCTL